jgi:hypothetical protein
MVSQSVLRILVNGPVSFPNKIVYARSDEISIAKSTKETTRFVRTYRDNRHASRIPPEASLIIRPRTDYVRSLDLLGDSRCLSVQKVVEWQVLEEDGRLDDLYVCLY